MHLGTEVPPGPGGEGESALGLIEDPQIKTRAALLPFRRQADCFLGAMSPSKRNLMEAFCFIPGSKSKDLGKECFLTLLKVVCHWLTSSSSVDVHFKGAQG